MFSSRIVTVNHYLHAPIPDLDVVFSDFRNSKVTQVPVLRIFGSTPAGQKTCLHIHGVFPYFYVPCDDAEITDKLLQQLALSIDTALQVGSGNAARYTQHVFKITPVSGRQLYGYRSTERQFLKIYFYNPLVVRRAAELLQTGAVLNKVFQPFECHVPFNLQFFIDYNLYGMNLINLAAVKFRKQRNEGHPLASDKCGETQASEDSMMFNSVSLQHWDISTIPGSQWLPDEVQRQSICELEVDGVATDILNRLDLKDNSNTNPGLVAIWEDERQRREQLNQLSELMPPSSPERAEITPQESEFDWLERLQEVVADQLKDLEEHLPTPEESHKASQDGGEVSPVSASQQSSNHFVDHLSQQPASQTLDEEVTPVVNEELALSFSQVSGAELSQAADKDLANLLMELGDEVEADSILSTQTPATQGEEDSDEAKAELASAEREESFAMSQVWEKEEEEDEDESMDESLIPEMDETSAFSQEELNSSSQLPQLDGQNDPKPERKKKSKLQMVQEFRAKKASHQLNSMSSLNPVHSGSQGHSQAEVRNVALGGTCSPAAPSNSDPVEIMNEETAPGEYTDDRAAGCKRSNETHQTGKPSSSNTSNPEEEMKKKNKTSNVTDTSGCSEQTKAVTKKRGRPPSTPKRKGKANLSEINKIANRVKVSCDNIDFNDEALTRRVDLGETCSPSQSKVNKEIGRPAVKLWRVNTNQVQGNVHSSPTDQLQTVNLGNIVHEDSFQSGIKTPKKRGRPPSKGKHIAVVKKTSGGEMNSSSKDSNLTSKCYLKTSWKKQKDPKNRKFQSIIHHSGGDNKSQITKKIVTSTDGIMGSVRSRGRPKSLPGKRRGRPPKVKHSIGGEPEQKTSKDVVVFDVKASSQIRMMQNLEEQVDRRLNVKSSLENSSNLGPGDKKVEPLMLRKDKHIFSKKKKEKVVIESFQPWYSSSPLSNGSPHSSSINDWLSPSKEDSESFHRLVYKVKKKRGRPPLKFKKGPANLENSTMSSSLECNTSTSSESNISKYGSRLSVEEMSPDMRIQTPAMVKKKKKKRKKREDITSKDKNSFLEYSDSERCVTDSTNDVLKPIIVKRQKDDVQFYIQRERVQDSIPLEESIPHGATVSSCIPNLPVLKRRGRPPKHKTAGNKGLKSETASVVGPKTVGSQTFHRVHSIGLPRLKQVNVNLSKVAINAEVESVKEDASILANTIENSGNETHLKLDSVSLNEMTELPTAAWRYQGSSTEDIHLTKDVSLQNSSKAGAKTKRRKKHKTLGMRRAWSHQLEDKKTKSDKRKIKKKKSHKLSKQLLFCDSFVSSDSSFIVTDSVSMDSISSSSVLLTPGKIERHDNFGHDFVPVETLRGSIKSVPSEKVTKGTEVMLTSNLVVGHSINLDDFPVEKLMSMPEMNPKVVLYRFHKKSMHLVEQSTSSQGISPRKGNLDMSEEHHGPIPTIPLCTNASPLGDGSLQHRRYIPANVKTAQMKKSNTRMRKAVDYSMLAGVRKYYKGPKQYSMKRDKSVTEGGDTSSENVVDLTVSSPEGEETQKTACVESISSCDEVTDHGSTSVSNNAVDDVSTPVKDKRKSKSKKEMHKKTKSKPWSWSSSPLAKSELGILITPPSISKQNFDTSQGATPISNAHQSARKIAKPGKRGPGRPRKLKLPEEKKEKTRKRSPNKKKMKGVEISFTSKKKLGSQGLVGGESNEIYSKDDRKETGRKKRGKKIIEKSSLKSGVYGITSVRGKHISKTTDSSSGKPPADENVFSIVSDESEEGQQPFLQTPPGSPYHDVLWNLAYPSPVLSLPRSSPPKFWSPTEKSTLNMAPSSEIMHSSCPSLKVLKSSSKDELLSYMSQDAGQDLSDGTSGSPPIDDWDSDKDDSRSTPADVMSTPMELFEEVEEVTSLNCEGETATQEISSDSSDRNLSWDGDTHSPGGEATSPEASECQENVTGVGESGIHSRVNEDIREESYVLPTVACQKSTNELSGHCKSSGSNWNTNGREGCVDCSSKGVRKDCSSVDDKQDESICTKQEAECGSLGMQAEDSDAVNDEGHPSSVAGGEGHGRDAADISERDNSDHEQHSHVAIFQEDPSGQNKVDAPGNISEGDKDNDVARGEDLPKTISVDSGEDEEQLIPYPLSMPDSISLSSESEDESPLLGLLDGVTQDDLSPGDSNNKVTPGEEKMADKDGNALSRNDTDMEGGVIENGSLKEVNDSLMGTKKTSHLFKLSVCHESSTSDIEVISDNENQISSNEEQTSHNKGETFNHKKGTSCEEQILDHEESTSLHGKETLDKEGQTIDCENQTSSFEEQTYHGKQISADENKTLLDEDKTSGHEKQMSGNEQKFDHTKQMSVSYRETLPDEDQMSGCGKQTSSNGKLAKEMPFSHKQTSGHEGQTIGIEMQSSGNEGGTTTPENQTLNNEDAIQMSVIEKETSVCDEPYIHPEIKASGNREQTSDHGKQKSVNEKGTVGHKEGVSNPEEQTSINNGVTHDKAQQMSVNDKGTVGHKKQTSDPGGQTSNHEFQTSDCAQEIAVSNKETLSNEQIFDHEEQTSRREEETFSENEKVFSSKQSYRDENQTSGHAMEQESEHSDDSNASNRLEDIATEEEELKNRVSPVIEFQGTDQQVKSLVLSSSRGTHNLTDDSNPLRDGNGGKVEHAEGVVDGKVGVDTMPDQSVMEHRDLCTKEELTNFQHQLQGEEDEKTTISCNTPLDGREERTANRKSPVQFQGTPSQALKLHEHPPSVEQNQLVSEEVISEVVEFVDEEQQDANNTEEMARDAESPILEFQGTASQMSKLDSSYPVEDESATAAAFISDSGNSFSDDSLLNLQSKEDAVKTVKLATGVVEGQAEKDLREINSNLFNVADQMETTSECQNDGKREQAVVVGITEDGGCGVQFHEMLAKENELKSDESRRKEEAASDLQEDDRNVLVVGSVSPHGEISQAVSPSCGSGMSKTRDEMDRNRRPALDFESTFMIEHSQFVLSDSSDNINHKEIHGYDPESSISLLDSEVSNSNQTTDDNRSSSEEMSHQNGNGKVTGNSSNGESKRKKKRKKEKVRKRKKEKGERDDSVFAKKKRRKRKPKEEEEDCTNNEVGNLQEKKKPRIKMTFRKIRKSSSQPTGKGSETVGNVKEHVTKDDFIEVGSSDQFDPQELFDPFLPSHQNIQSASSPSKLREILSRPARLEGYTTMREYHQMQLSQHASKDAKSSKADPHKADMPRSSSQPERKKKGDANRKSYINFGIIEKKDWRVGLSNKQRIEELKRVRTGDHPPQQDGRGKARQSVSTKSPKSRKSRQPRKRLNTMENEVIEALMDLSEIGGVGVPRQESIQRGDTAELSSNSGGYSPKHFEETLGEKSLQRESPIVVSDNASPCTDNEVIVVEDEEEEEDVVREAKRAKIAEPGKSINARDVKGEAMRMETPKRSVSKSSIMDEESSERNLVCYIPVRSPPTRKEIQTSLAKYGLTDCSHQVPYWEKSGDIPSFVREAANMQVQLSPNLPGALKEALPPSSSVGLNHWRAVMFIKDQSAPLLSQGQTFFSEEGRAVMKSLMESADCKRDVVLTPCKLPPSTEEVSRWLQNNSKQRPSALLSKDAATEGSNISPKDPAISPSDSEIILQSCDKAGNDERSQTETVEEDPPSPFLQELIDGIEPSTPPRFSGNLTSPVSSLTPENLPLHSTPMMKETTCKPNQPVLTPILVTASKKDPAKLKRRVSLADTVTVVRPNVVTPAQASMTTPLMKKGSFTSQLEGPSLKNAGGFKCSQSNLQDAKALHENQHLTLMSVEVHAHSRGKLRPDPEFDPVRAIFFCIASENYGEGVGDGARSEHVGVIAVDNPNKNRLQALDQSQPPFTLYGLSDIEVTNVKDETEMFEELVKLVQKHDPDFFIGYEIQQYSWGYLLDRASALEFKLCASLSRIPDNERESHFSAEKDEYGANHTSEINIAGRIVLNVWRLLRHEVALNVYTFENVAYHVLHQRVPLFSFQDLSAWYDHQTHLLRWRVVEHYIYRVTGNLKILKQLDLIGRTSELARLFGIEFFSVLSRGSQYRVESMMLRQAKAQNYVAISPSVQQRSVMKAPECIPLILEPESRLYEDPVIVLDFQSLYPSMMIGYNYCFSTCLGRVEHIARGGHFVLGCSTHYIPPTEMKRLLDSGGLHISPNGVVYVKKTVRHGILPRMLEQILQTRIMVKKGLKDHKDDKVLQRMLDNRQLGLKLIANVTYGYTSASFSGRMPCIEVADSIVMKARETLERSIHLVENTPEWGAKLVYGDTDSMFVMVKGATKERAFQVGKEIVEAVSKVNPKPVKLKLEKVYKPCVLQAKKRYVGFKYESPDQKEPELEAKGIETIRRDTCPAVAKILEKALKIVFTTQNVSQVKQYVQKQFQKIIDGKINLQDLIFAKEYRGRQYYKPGACIPALELTRRGLSVDKRSEPRVGERVPYVIVNGVPGLPLIQLVRRPEEIVTNPSLIINSTYYVTRQIIPALNRVFGIMGVETLQWFQELPRTVRVSMAATKQQNQTRKGTISQYFCSLNCAICDQLTKTGLCDDCRKQPQLVASVLNRRIQDHQRAWVHLTKICCSCTGFPEHEPSCVSIDCPIRHRVSRTLQKMNSIPQLVQLVNEMPTSCE